MRKNFTSGIRKFNKAGFPCHEQSYNKKYYENWNPVGKYNFGKVIPHAERFRIMAKSIFKATKILNLGFVYSDNSLLTINQQDLIASALNLKGYEQEEFL